MNTPARKLSTVRERLRERQAARQRRLRLERELAFYSSPADRSELDAILSRHTPEQVHEIDTILNQQASSRMRHLTRPPR